MEKTVCKQFLAILCSLLLLAGSSCSAKPGEPANEPMAITQTPYDLKETPSLPHACASPGKDIPTPATTKMPSPYASDYAFLWQALETDYPYLPYLKQNGINIDRIRERYAEQADQAQNDQQFLTILEKLFRDLNNTAHLSVLDSFSFQSIYSLFVLDPALSSEPELAFFRKVLQDPGLSKIYVPPIADDVAAAEQLGYYPAPIVIYYDDCKTICITIKTFLHETVERDRNLVKESMERYPDAENVVFNILGNGGGSDAYWMENLVKPFGGDFTFTYREFFRDTTRNREYFEPVQTDILYVRDASDVPDWVRALGLDRYVCSELVFKGSGSVHSDVNRWVLVNDKVYSAAETFVCFCKATGWATVVGTQTKGDGMGSDPLLLMLPDSGLLIRFSNTAGENPDGSMSIEGTTPDIVLPSAGILQLMDIIRKSRTE